MAPSPPGGAEERARARFEESIERLGLSRSLSAALSPSIAGEGPRRAVWEGALRRLGFDPSGLDRWWERTEEDDRRRDETRARNGDGEEKRHAVGALTLLLAYAAPSGDSSQVVQALEEIDPAWTADPACRAWSGDLAAIAASAPDPDVRIRALQTLERIGDPAVADVLLDIVERDADTSVRTTAAYAVLGIAGALADHPRARTVLETVSDARTYDLAPNLARYATRALERMGSGPAPMVEVDWSTVIEDQLSAGEVQALLALVDRVGDTIVRFYGAHVSEPSPESVGALLRIFEANPDAGLVHGSGLGHVLARTEAVRALNRAGGVSTFTELVARMRAAGLGTGYAPSVSI